MPLRVTEEQRQRDIAQAKFKVDVVDAWNAHTLTTAEYIEALVGLLHSVVARALRDEVEDA